MRPAAITLCFRPIPAIQDARCAVTCLLEEAGHRVCQVPDGRLGLRVADIVWLEGNANWYPRVCRQLLATPRSEPPLVVTWHSARSVNE